MTPSSPSRRWLLLVLVVLVASVVPRAAAGGSSDTAGDPLLDLSTCRAPAEGFALFCEVYEEVHDTYLDPVEDRRLAEGALRSMRRLGEEREARLARIDLPLPPPRSNPVACTAPAGTFEEFCRLYAELRTGSVAPPSRDELVEAATTGMVGDGLGDPQSTYLTPERYRLLQEEQSGQIEGIGAEVATENLAEGEKPCSVLSTTCVMVIVAPVAGGPAEQAGLRAGDIVVSTDGRSVAGTTLWEQVERVRGPAGTEVTLDIRRGEGRLRVTIIREAVPLHTVEARLLEPGLGYLRLAMFGIGSHAELRQGLAGLLDAGAGRLVLDLRDNPGGSLHAAIDIASEFLADGLVLTQEGRGDDAVEWEVEPGGLATDPGLEIVVLINQGSASASEVVAVALQEHRRATLIGEPSFGKDTVQAYSLLGNGGALRLTIARWFTPGHRSVGGNGLQPDVLVYLPDDAEDDTLLERARDWLSQAGS